MRREVYPGDHETLIVEHARDLERLPPWARAAVPRSLRRWFLEYPGSLRALAARARRRPMALALERLAAGAACEIEINRPRQRKWAKQLETYLRFPHAPLVLLSGAIRAPARCPPALGEVLELVGPIRVQYLCAEGFLRPRQQRSLPAIVRTHRRNMLVIGQPAWVRDAYASLVEALGLSAEAAKPSWSEPDLPLHPERYFAFYESSGQYVFASPGGRGWLYSLTGGDYGPVRSVGRWLDDYFEKLAT